MSYFLLQRGGKSSRVRIESFPVAVGRDAVNGIVIDDPAASRFHLKVKRRGVSYIIQDLGSKNGTYLNGEKIVNSVLKNNDQLQIGTTTLTFVHSAKIAQNIEESLELDLKDFDNRPPLARGFLLRRVSPEQLIETCEKKKENCQLIYNYHANLMIISTIENAGRQLVACAKLCLPSIVRMMLFTWDSKAKHLLPIAHQEYEQEEGGHFKINSEHLAQVINRQQVLFLSAAQSNIAVLPMLLFGKVVGLAHLEFAKAEQEQTFAALGMVQALLNRCAAHFEMLALSRALNRWSLSMVKSITRTLEEKDTYTMGHSERVGRYALAMAQVLGLDNTTKHNLLASALCHDIGKIGIPDSILKKSTMLRSDEYEEMKQHPVLGAEIIAHIPNSADFVSGILYHHERWNGTGYPEGLAGEDIPFFGRIIAIADSFDAMVSGRSYSGFMKEEEALAKLMTETDLYDPEILEAFASAHQDKKIKVKTDTLIEKNEK